MSTGSLPMDILLLRHGRGEGNAVMDASKQGDHSLYNAPGFAERHGSFWRLTDKGIGDVKFAGEWLRENFSKFDRYYVSEYLRAMETAALLGLNGAKWQREIYLHERSYGWHEGVPHNIQNQKYAEELARRESSTFFWKPPGGESMVDVCMRVDRMLDIMRRECAGKRAIAVSHGELMWGYRTRLEGITQERWIELDTSKDKADKIYNGQIIHYSRRNPTTGKVSRNLDWMRMIRPDDEKFSREWRRIVRPKFTNDQLLAVVQKTKRLVNV